MRELTSVTADGNILKLVERFLCAGVMQDGVVESPTLGPSQGGVVSPLLANVALNFLDWQQDELGLRFVRYAGRSEAAPLRRPFRYPPHSPGVGNPHAGKWKEANLLRKRGADGTPFPDPFLRSSVCRVFQRPLTEKDSQPPASHTT